MKCSKMYMKAEMLENVYEGFNACSEVHLSKECFCIMYPTCVSSYCEFIQLMIPLVFLSPATN